MTPPKFDLDELALLEEERDHLLASLRDLEREYDAGDMDRADYETLRDDYTARAAKVLEAIEAQRPPERDTSRRSPGRTVLVTACVVGFALLAGFGVAQWSGHRGGGAITGAVGTERARLMTCRQIGPDDLSAVIECYDDILADAPDHVEALTYRGWALIRNDQVAEGADDLTRAVEVDPDYPDARVFRAIVAARAGNHELAAAEIDRFYRNRPSPEAIQILESQGLEREIFIMTVSEPTRACWTDAAASQDPDAPDASAFLSALRVCLEDLLLTDPTDVDALVSLAYTTVGPNTTELSEPVAIAQRAVDADPRDANARLLRATLALAEGRFEDAEADLAALEELPRPTASFLFGGPERVRTALDSAAQNSGESRPTPNGEPPSESGPTTTTPAGDAPLIPNPDGG